MKDNEKNSPVDLVKTENHPPPKTLEGCVLKWLWGVAVILFWGLFSEALLLKFFGWEPIGLSPFFILLPFSLFIYTIFREPRRQILYRFLNFFFLPLYGFLLLVANAHSAFSYLVRLCQSIWGWASFTCSSKGIAAFVFGCFFTLLFSPFLVWLPFKAISCFLSGIFLLMGLIISLNFSLNPRIPVEQFVNFTHSTFNWLILKYCDIFWKDGLEIAPGEDFAFEEALIKKGIYYIELFEGDDFKIVPKRYLVIFFSACFIFIFLGSLGLFATIVQGLNQISISYPSHFFVISGRSFGLFETLPTDSPFFDCLFQAFTILFGCQDFTLQSTSIVGRCFILLSVLWNSFFLVFIVSSFFTIIGLEKDIKTETEDLFPLPKKLFQTLLKEIFMLREKSSKIPEKGETTEEDSK